MALGHQRRASFLALAALAAVFSLLPRYIPDIAWVTTVPFQLLLDSQGLSARPYASPRRTETGMRSAPSDLDPAVAEKLKAAQERISQAKQAMAVLRNELCGRNFFSPEIDRSLLIEVLRLFAPESAKPMREPILQKELINMIPDMRQDTEALAALINAMATVRLAYEPAWQLLADVVVEECSSASGRQLVAFAWAFATAGEPRQDLWTALKSMMAGKRKELSAEERVTFAWSCAEVGQHATELFGEASEVAAEKESRAMLEAIRNLDGKHLLKNPPVVLVPDVVTPEQSQELIRLADESKLWWQSSRRGARTAAGEDALRTSSSAVLSAPRMFQEPPVKAIRSWASQVLKVPEDTVEALQLVRYQKGEQYSTHVDWGRKQDASLWLGGQRTATALIYLNTLPKDCGGETSFERLGIQVSPQAGAALVWPNVDSSGRPQDLVEHRAMPVLCETQKYAVNVWIREKPLPAYRGD
ncbi:unnamed protein product [Durusdinium trenchii]|uniref:Fe2OG dioxygenase domain-containing protein n=1 Tax=Durusdinium trenchii TaxID=1381693 RepID=A0ABP0S6P0_9DINO